MKKMTALGTIRRLHSRKMRGGPATPGRDPGMLATFELHRTAALPIDVVAYFSNSADFNLTEGDEVQILGLVRELRPARTDISMEEMGTQRLADITNEKNRLANARLMTVASFSLKMLEVQHIDAVVGE